MQHAFLNPEAPKALHLDSLHRVFKDLPLIDVSSKASSLKDSSHHCYHGPTCQRDLPHRKLVTDRLLIHDIYLSACAISSS